MTVQPRRFHQVDVFSAEPLQGNPLAVVHDADGLDDAHLAAIARWTNLSETTFLLPPTDPAADYRVRIFTQTGELPFAGHPTLGTCHAWLEAGGKPRHDERIVQQCPAGLIPIRRIDGVLAFEAPPVLRSGPVAEADLERIARVLGIPRDEVVASQWVDNGPGWVAVMLESAAAVLRLRPMGDGKPLDLGIVGLYPRGAECAYEVRAIFTNHRDEIMEDPVTGSLNASLAQWLIGAGLAEPPYVTSQGTVMGRAGRPRISQAGDGAIWVGGATRTIVEGAVEVE